MTTTTEIAQPRPQAGREVGALAWIAVQLGVILVLARAFNLESPAFYGIVLPLAAGGFLIHHWLPRRYQLWFFVALSVAGILLVFGLVSGTWLLGVGLGLIALCHLPIAFRWRLVLILLAAAGLVAMRATWLPTPWPGAIWPILGSMFMFRLAMYLYDLKHRGPSPPAFALSYFFLLPNSVFLLFPVIDFRTFQRTYFDRPAFAIYEEGVRWMFRGLTHLVLYRVIYQSVALSPTDVSSTATLVQYLVANFGLLLRVSGQFHMIVGLLHLFGFRLPETHRFYYLASSFSDLWRRMNIYWKDAMQKLVFMPVVLSLTQRGQTTAMVVATVCVITITWLLHSYQWFWLLGTWLLSATDLAFWAIIGVFLITSTVREQRRGRTRQLTAQVPTRRQAWREAMQTAGMFALMAFLWGLWTSPTFADFRVMLGTATWRMFDVAVVLGLFAVVAAAAYICRRLGWGTLSESAAPPRWQHPLLVAALPLALVWVAGHPRLEGQVPSQVQAVVQQARLAELNRADADRLQRGYYEKIVGVNRFNGELWEVYARTNEQQQPDDILFGEGIEQGTGDSSIWKRHDDALGYSLVPLNRTTFKGATFTTNRWGMRDKEYEKTPPPRTRRIAVLGQSYSMGAGVNDGETFEALIEEHLNREWSPKTGFRYEVLNFATSGYLLDKHALILKNGRVSAFQPDVVLIIGNSGDERNIAKDVVRQLKLGLLSEPVTTWLTEAGVTKDTSDFEAVMRLKRRAPDLVRMALETVASEARRMGAQPVLALVPVPRMTDSDVTLLSAAAAAGLLASDLRDVYEGHDQRSLTVSDRDFHPNKEGHRIIAERLYKELTEMPLGILADEDSMTPEEQARLWEEWNHKQLAGQEAMEARIRAQPGAQASRLGGVADAGDRTGARRRGPAGDRANNTAANARGVPAAPLPIEGWTVDTRDGNVAALASNRTDNWMRVTIQKLASRSASSVRLQKGPVPVTRDHRYALTFWMSAEAARPVTCGLASGADADKLLGTSSKVDAGTWWQEFSCAFKATATDANARIFFDLGASESALEMSRVELRDLSTGTVIMSTDPSWKPSVPRVR